MSDCIPEMVGSLTTADHSRRRYRVLLIAEAANPEWTSVPLVGWSHARALAALADVDLVTQVRNREAIVRAGLQEGAAGSNGFTAIDSEKFARPIWRLGKLIRGGAGKGWTTVTALASIAYYGFEHLVWQRFGDQIRAGQYDLVHRLVPLSPTIPSLLAARCKRVGVPFVVGPLNGGVAWPQEFDRARRQEREWLSYARGAYRLLPGYRGMRRNAAAVLVGSMDTWRQMPEVWRSKCVYVPENGVDPTRFQARRPARPAGPLRVIFVGRLVPYKGADMMLEAVSPLVREGVVEVEIVGDGPLTGTLKELIVREGIERGVTLSGWLKHEEVQDRLVRADVFAFPSIREFGGAVVLEAMAQGVVPVVVDYGGPAEMVTDCTGYKVAMGDRAAVVVGFRRVLTGVAASPEQLESRRIAGKRRVEDYFTWDAKAKQVLEVYRWVLGERADKPDFGMPFPDPEVVGVAGGESAGDDGRSVAREVLHQ